MAIILSNITHQSEGTKLEKEEEHNLTSIILDAIQEYNYDADIRSDRDE
jgi:hypothetical protein